MHDSMIALLSLNLRLNEHLMKCANVFDVGIVGSFVVVVDKLPIIIIRELILLVIDHIHNGTI